MHNQQLDVKGKASASSKRMRIITLLLCLAITITVVIGASYSWFQSIGEIVSAGSSAKMSARSILFVPKQLVFELDTTKHGIPGETVEVTTSNFVTPLQIKDNYIFGISYTLSSQSISYIDGLSLQPEVVERMNLLRTVEEEEDGSITVTYFGLGYNGQAVDLGPLLVRFSMDGELQMGQSLQIDAKVRLCQHSREAFQDIFGLEDAQMAQYAPLFTT